MNLGQRVRLDGERGSSHLGEQTPESIAEFQVVNVNGNISIDKVHQPAGMISILFRRG